jgi:nucleoside-diphosphate-sugar epimerase
MFASVAQLEQQLAEPNDADREVLRGLSGDVVILGAGGKMGPTLAMRVRRALTPDRKVWAVSRFSDAEAADRLEDEGVEVLGADLLEPGALADLPDADNVLYLAGRKFGSTGDEGLTWVMNAWLPGAVAQRYARSRIVALSSGNVYPFMPLSSGGATEQTATLPVGEYAQSVLGRERVFTWFCQQQGTPLALLRLNYAAEMRYGVLLDIGTRVFERQPVDLTPTLVNVLWQGDANSMVLRALASASVPARVLNITGPEMLSVRWIAERFAQQFGTTVSFTGEEQPTALLNNAAAAQRAFGYPSVDPETLIEWTARWIGMGGETHNKPTHFETRSGRF